MEEYKQALKDFGSATWPEDAELPRYERMIASAVRSPPEPARPVWLMPGLALAGVGAMAVAFVAIQPPATSPAQPLAMTIDAAAVAQTVELTEHVVLESAGEAVVSGTEMAPLIELRSGRLQVQVEPQQGVDLRVRTAEGEVRVIGTVFVVERSELGTRVEVSRGKVAVNCGIGSAADLTPEVGAFTCLPTTAPGMLGRARALETQGGAEDELMAALDAGLSMSPDAATQGELLALRLAKHAESQDYAAALTDARAYLAGGEEARRDEVLENAARLAQAVEGCEAAGAYLDELDQRGQAERVADLAESCGR